MEDVAGIATGSSDVILNVAGMLHLGTGAGESITAPAAVVDLNAAGVTENGGSVVSAAGLRLRGIGAFALPNANAVATLAGDVTGPVTVTTPGPVAVGPLRGTPGLASGGGDITLAVTAGDLTANGPVQAGVGTVDLTVAGAVTGVGGARVAGAALAVHSATAVGTAITPLDTAVPAPTATPSRPPAWFGTGTSSP